MLKADMIQVGDYSTRFIAQNSNAWALDPAFEFADTAVAVIASRCPQVISALLAMNDLFTILKQPDEISQQERSAKRG